MVVSGLLRIQVSEEAMPNRPLRFHEVGLK